MKLEFETVPPPMQCPVQDMAQTLGLVDGLRVENNRSSQFRCSFCNGWIRNGEAMVWVPDGIRRGDPPEVITEQCRLNAFNGHFTACCVSCAPKQRQGNGGLLARWYGWCIFACAALLVAAWAWGAL